MKFRNICLKMFTYVSIIVILLFFQPISAFATTSADTTIISTAEELKAFSQSVKDGQNYIGKTVILASDIDLSNNTANWARIGDIYHPFSGTFDGCGHTISKVKINLVATNYQSFFGYVSGATIKNVNLKDVNISGKIIVGGLVGQASDLSVIENCTVSGTVFGGGLVGGIVGKIDSSTINNCYNLATVTNTGENTGGVVGYISAELDDGISIVTHCYNLGAISGVSFVGGIVGLAEPANSSSTIKVEQNVSLAQEIKRSSESESTFHRVAGGFVANIGVVSLADNGAWADMKVLGATISVDSPALLEGLSLDNTTISNIETWTSMFGFSKENWTISAYKLPILTNINIEYQSNLMSPHLVASVPNPPLGGNGDVKKGVTITGLSVENKVYDKTASATISGTATIDGKFEGDILTVNVGIATFSDASVGANKQVSFQDFSLDGDDKDKYALVQQPANVTANIAKKPLENSMITGEIEDVEYDGEQHTPTAAVTDGTIEPTDYEWSYANNTNAGFADAIITATDNGNYSGSASKQFTINKKNVVVTAENKTIKCGETLPIPSVIYAGFVGADTEINALETQAVAKLNVANSTTEGASTIDFSQLAVPNDTIGANYLFNYVGGTLTITKADFTTQPPQPTQPEPPTEIEPPLTSQPPQVPQTPQLQPTISQNSKADTIVDVAATKSIELKVETSVKLIDNLTLTKLSNIDKLNETLLKEIYTVNAFKGANSQKAEPFKVTVNVSHLTLNAAQKENFTGVLYDENLQSYKQLGGEFSADGKTFAYFTAQSGQQGVIISDNLVKMQFTIGEKSFTNKGKTEQNDVAPIISGGRTMLPIRIVAQTLGAQVSWNEQENAVRINKDGETTKIFVNKPLPNSMGVSFIKYARAFVPVRYVAETLGANVVWNEQNKSVSIYQ